MANAEATLKKVFQIYPDDKDVIMQLVDFYINNDKLDEAYASL